eukprot:TRINITY_DN9133_c0_g1_i3.p1 TRINITY_DN9133_c0_g1~~TRINITY_DN9133_c0_g1_i3.p1  ORF type:complete len:789 (-),score=403.60 TRINITY_DN9133_c0_g1_i3:76-2442(-)
MCIRDRYNIMSQMRMGSEEDNQQISDAYATRKRELQEQRDKLQKYEVELDKVNLTLRQVENYNEQMKAEIAVTRRATYKAEADLQQIEEKKKWQDLYIDQQHDKIKRLEEQLALHDAQYDSQRQETKAAADTLHEAAEEMQGINYEKRTLLQQWKSSLIALQRRDEALQQTENELRAQRERLLTQQTEISGYKKGIEQEQFTNEKLTATLGKLQGEIGFVEHLLEEVKEKRAKLNEKYVMLKKSLDLTDVELHNVAKDVDAVNTDAKEVDKEWVKVHSEKSVYEDKIEATMSEQTTFERYASGEQKDARKVHEEASEKEVQVSQLQNELARIRVDSLNTLAHNNALKDTRNSIIKDLSEKEGLIDQIDVEIARKNTLIERKQVDIDKLNKRYEALTAGTEEENMGPLEATIHSQHKEIANKAAECGELKRTWMKHQTELVSVNLESVEQSHVNDNLKSQVAILFQQRIRLDNNIFSQEKQLQGLHRNVSNLRGDMQRFNTLIAQATQQEQELGSANLRLETEFKNRLVALEQECIGMESSVDVVKEEKAVCIEDIKEAEQQIMLIERKIMLAKEIVEALDPNVGRAENTKMKQEIHRMELRYVQLKKKQEEMIKEMEDAIYRKEAIKTKGKTKQKHTGAGSAATLKLELTGLDRQIKEKTASLEQYNESINQYQEAYNERLLEDQHLTESMADVKGKIHELQHEYEYKVESKKLLLETIMRNQKAAKHLNKLSKQDTAPQSTVSPGAIQQLLQQEQDNTHKLSSVLQALDQQLPDLGLSRSLVLTQMQ